MTGLTVLLVSPDPTRARAALTLAISAATLGGRARLFAQDVAVAMFVPGTDSDDGALQSAGLPTRADLLAMAPREGVALLACQTGMAMAGLEIASLASGVEAGGLMGVMADLGEDRLVTI